MKKVIFVFGTKRAPFAPQFEMSINLCLEIEKNLQTKYVAIYDDAYTNALLEQTLDGFELSSDNGLKNVIVLYCGKNFDSFHNWRDCEKINLSYLVEKFIEVADTCKLAKQEDVVNDLFMYGACSALPKYEEIDEFDLVQKLAEVVGGKETEEQKEMAKKLFFYGVPGLLQIEKLFQPS